MAAGLGIRKIRIMGGEPLLYPNIEKLIHRLTEIQGIQECSIHTNGILLEEKVQNLYEAGVRHIHLSLDTLSAEKFQNQTHRDAHAQVMKGFAVAEQTGFDRLYISTVVVRGFNEKELVDIARLSLNHSVIIRFIELSPIGSAPFWEPGKRVTIQEIKTQIGTLGDLIPINISEEDIPSHERRYRLPRSLGQIGFITPVNEDFCTSCNRIRLSSTGILRGCLISNGFIDIKNSLREGATEEELREQFLNSIRPKPEKHFLSVSSEFDYWKRCMFQFEG